jgi:dinuclear metal center YbgI/SA1388 family protein
MIPTLKDILDVLEALAPCHTAEEWDNPGLQVGDLSQEIRKIFISLDPTLKAIRKAAASSAQLLLTHHPLIFEPISTLNHEHYPGNVISEAFNRGISIVCAHSNLDVARGGINDALAQLFDLRHVEVLEKRDALGIEGAGLGRIGDLPEPVKLSAMAEKVKALLGSDTLKLVNNNTKIKRVAVVGGSGGAMVSLAAKKGADLLITGDVGHHDALEAENFGLALIDAGHFYTEKAALRLFADRLGDAFTERNLAVKMEVYDDEINPMRYG